MYKKLLHPFLIFCLMVLIGSLNVTITHAQDDLVDTSWTLSFMQNEDGYIHPISPISIQFNSNGLYGDSGCNTYGGHDLTWGDEEIEISGFSVTYKWCEETFPFPIDVDETQLNETQPAQTSPIMEIEFVYLDFLGSPLEWSVVDDGTLVLCNQTTLAVFNPSDFESLLPTNERTESYTCSLCEMDFCSDNLNVERVSKELGDILDVSGIDIELGDCLPIESADEYTDAAIDDADNCIAVTRSNVPLSVSSHMMKASGSTSTLMFLNVGVTAMGLSLLSLKICRYGRN